MERVKLDNRRILFNLLPAHVAQHFLLSNPRNMVSRPPGPHRFLSSQPPPGRVPSAGLKEAPGGGRGAQKCPPWFRERARCPCPREV